MALASAAASQAARGWTRKRKVPLRDSSLDPIRAIWVEVSKNIFKNGFAITIPNANGHKGLLMSAALGVHCDPTKDLRLLADVRSNHLLLAECMLAENRVHVNVKDDASCDVYIKTKVEFE